MPFSDSLISITTYTRIYQPVSNLRWKYASGKSSPTGKTEALGEWEAALPGICCIVLGQLWENHDSLVRPSVPYSDNHVYEENQIRKLQTHDTIRRKSSLNGEASEASSWAHQDTPISLFSLQVHHYWKIAISSTKATVELNHDVTTFTW